MLLLVVGAIAKSENRSKERCYLFSFPAWFKSLSIKVTLLKGVNLLKAYPKRGLSFAPSKKCYRVLNHAENPQLPFGEREFEAVLIAVSVQYLQYPEAIFSEIHRLLKSGGRCIVSFSNRMFSQKAIAAWREGTDLQRINLIKGYFQAISGFGKPQTIIEVGKIPSFLQMFAMGGVDPFYALIAEGID